MGVVLQVLCTKLVRFDFDTLRVVSTVVDFAFQGVLVSLVAWPQVSN